MKNYLGQTLGLATLLLAALTGLSLLPDGMSFAGFPIRRMDIFSDVQKDAGAPSDLPILDSIAFQSDSTASLTVADTVQRDSMGWIPVVADSLFGRLIEDYTTDQRGLSQFFAAIDSIRPHRRTVRVAFFGDSFVEGDILLGDLRDTLQSVWGGAGVGFVPITSEVARFKRTLVHRYEKWNTFSIVKNHGSGQPFGINGFVYRPAQGASAFYEGADYFSHTRSWDQFRLFYMANNNDVLTWQWDNLPLRVDTLTGEPGRLKVWHYEHPGMRAFSLLLDNPDTTTVLYGASLESGPGFYLDNFSVRGNTGGRLKLISPSLVRQFDQNLRYDLIIVQLGLNAVTPSLNNINWYRAELDQTFAHLQNCFPGKTILLLSVADRAGKVDGELATLPSVAAITGMQRDLARKYGFLFFDLYRGMGGSGTMINFAHQKPALANKDYTHLTHEGGKVMGHLFAKLFLDAQAQYHNKAESARTR